MGLSLINLLCQDLARSERRTPPASISAQLLFVVRFAPKVRSLAVIGFRIAHASGSYSAILGNIVKMATQVITGADIAYQARIGPGLALLHPSGVVVSGDAVIGERCTIHQGVTVGGSPSGAPVIGDEVNLGPGARILGAVTIGENSHVGANAVVTRSFHERNVVIAGIPARVIRDRGAS
jgi:serine O-acetyltransferase